MNILTPLFHSRPHIVCATDLDRTIFRTDEDNDPPGQPHEDAEVIIPYLCGAHEFHGDYTVEMEVITKEAEAGRQALKWGRCGFRSFVKNLHIVKTLRQKFLLMEAWHKANTDPNTIYVAIDDLNCGMIAFGNRLGWPTIQVMRGPHAEEVPKNDLQRPKYRIDDLYGLEQVLGLILTDHAHRLRQKSR